MYSYWHFDDFSWGETRKVTGEVKGDDHGKQDGVFDPSKVPLKRWEDYERKRIRGVKRRERKLRELGQPVHYFDPSKEAPGKAVSGYYPTYRPPNNSPPPTPEKQMSNQPLYQPNAYQPPNNAMTPPLYQQQQPRMMMAGPRPPYTRPPP